MKRQCAWCGSSLDPVGSEGRREAVSHGICDRCADFLSGDLGVPLGEFLEGLGTPVYLVDVSAGARVRLANRDGLELVGKEPGEVEGDLLGDVFECANAALPGGCGRTVHCSGCVIRRTVEHTWRTGEALTRVPATLKPRDPEAPPLVSLEISTERAGGEVLLRIDGAAASLDSPDGARANQRGTE